MNRPLSYEGLLFAELIPRLETQLRVVAGADGLLLLGVDLTAVLALAGATGLPPAAVANWLPAIEAAVVHAINRQIRDRTPDG